MTDRVEQILRELDRPIQPREEFRDRLLGEALASLQATRTEPLARRRFPLFRELLAAATLLVVVIGLVVGVRALRASKLSTPSTASPSVSISPSPKVSAAPIVSVIPSKMVSTNAGWALEQGRLLRTTDGAMHWSVVGPPYLADSIASDTSAYFLDAQNAVITETAGGNSLSLASFRTSDGGKTWQQGARVAAPGFGGDGLSPRLYFTDDLHGWLLLRGGFVNGQPPSPALYGTSDGGLHWTLRSSKLPSPLGCLAWDLAFVSSSTGWLTTICDSTQARPSELMPSLLITHDAGVTWQAQRLPLTTSDVICSCSIDPPVFVDRQHGILFVRGSPGALFVTSDAGSDWIPRSLPSGPTDVDFSDASHGWAIAGYALYHTSDGGASWAPVRTDLLAQGGHIEGLVFVDQMNGFASRITSAGSSQLLKTTDGGFTWTLVPSG